ncbi:hypothetical protein DLJ53_20765 [Acuticoccus sediminis]|uniref:Uncharacterized protein n=1 Tax=Acuticoccus sediminis TaxID=2184697 RepID=A0A8B2NKK4_9HYPH|nr:hypothetical protein [Acuticoccus sediminis]RAI00145.1 hypothetical protein DLJ53_20765 [Acuticoccus sediminis]
MTLALECYVTQGGAAMTLEQLAAAADVDFDDVRSEVARWIVDTNGEVRRTHFNECGNTLCLNRNGVRLMLERLGVEEDLASTIERRLDRSESHMETVYAAEPAAREAAE